MTGFADEASQDLAAQIAVTKKLGWNAIESRSIGGTNIHDLPDAEFERAADMLDAAGVWVNCFGSTIANWGKHIDDPFEITLAEVERAIPRMQRLGTGLVRIMSYARCPGGGDAETQKAEERFRRLREIVRRFTDAGLTPVHENCMNYGGMSPRHSLALVENVPGLKLAYDTGNPAILRDYSKEGEQSQNPLEFFAAIRPHVAYIHIKDAKLEDEREVFTYPGEGGGRLPEVLRALVDSGYDGGISIEPHMATVFHDPDAGRSTDEEASTIYIEYGRRVEKLLADAGAKVGQY